MPLLHYHPYVFIRNITCLHIICITLLHQKRKWKHYEYYLTDPEVGYFYRLQWENKEFQN